MECLRCPWTPAAHLCLQVVPALCQLGAPLRQAEPRRPRQPQLVAHRQVGPLGLEQQGHVPNVGHIMQRQHMAAGHLAEVGLQRTRRRVGSVQQSWFSV